MKNNQRRTLSKYSNLQVGDNDLIGNKFNGHDLHINLRAMGIDSSHLVWNKESDDKNTYVIAGDKTDREIIRSYNEYIQQLYDLNNIHNPLIYDIIYNKLFLDADVVHLHLLHNGLWDLNLLPLISKLKPIIWTVHDMWIATGNLRAEKRPDYFFPLNNIKNLDFNWELKKEAIRNSNVTFVVASKYMEKAMNEYPLFKEKRIVYIPFGLDFKIFYPRDNVATRKELGLDLSEKLILLRGDGGVRKGLNYIENIMKTLGKKYKLHFLIVGNNELVIPSGVKITCYDWVRDDELMAKLYSVADLFLMPSTREYFGMMAIESMACGTLPIVLDGTSLPEAVNYLSCGVSTRQDFGAYSKAVEYYLNHAKEKTCRVNRCIDYVRKKHDMDKYLKSIDEIYRTAIKNFVHDASYDKIIVKLRDINETTPFLKASIANIANDGQDKYQEKNLFFEATVTPLREEIARLQIERDTLKNENTRLINSTVRRKMARFVNKINEKVNNKLSKGNH